MPAGDSRCARTPWPDHDQRGVGAFPTAGAISLRSTERRGTGRAAAAPNDRSCLRPLVVRAKTRDSGLPARSHANQRDASICRAAAPPAWPRRPGPPGIASAQRRCTAASAATASSSLRHNPTKGTNGCQVQRCRLGRDFNRVRSRCRGCRTRPARLPAQAGEVCRYAALRARPTVGSGARRRARRSGCGH